MARIEGSPTAALILGAGWSAPAGYPLATELLTGPIAATTDRSAARVRGVLDAFRAWRKIAGQPLSEAFLALVREGRIRRPVDPQRPTLFDHEGGPMLPWPWAVEAVMLRLAGSTLLPRAESAAENVYVLSGRDANHLRYGAQIGTPARSPTHTDFIRKLLSRFRLSGVVTTNYDTLTERVLRHRPMARSPEPGFYYGGLPAPQRALGSSSWDYYHSLEGRSSACDLSGGIPVFKLHGSLNWEVKCNVVQIWRDMRLSYRDGGLAAIVAPTPEKAVDRWLLPVWAAAEDALRRAERWIVVGYSLPEYDLAVHELLTAAASGGSVRCVEIYDPYAQDLKARWEDALQVAVIPRPGLPASRPPHADSRPTIATRAKRGERGRSGPRATARRLSPRMNRW
jgi:hypothetical protein